MQEPIVREKNPIVVMETNHGTIEVELYWKESPKLAENFLSMIPQPFIEEVQSRTDIAELIASEVQRG